MAAPSRNFSPLPLLTQLQPCPSPSQEGLSHSPGSWSSSRDEGSHPALTLGVISPEGMPPAAAPGPGQGQNQTSSEESLPVPTSAPLGLSASWSSPGSRQMVQGSGGRKFRGRGTQLVRGKDPLTSAPLSPATRQVPGPSIREADPPRPTHSRSSLSLTRPSTEQEQAGFLFRGTSPPSAMHHFVVVRMGSPRVDVMLIHPPQSWRRPGGHCLPTCSSGRPQDSAPTEPQILYLPRQFCPVTPGNFLRPTLALVPPRVHIPQAGASPLLGPALPTSHT